MNEDSRMTDISDSAFLPRGKIQRDELKLSAKALCASQFIYMLKQHQTRDVSGLRLQLVYRWSEKDKRNVPSQRIARKS